MFLVVVRSSLGCGDFFFWLWCSLFWSGCPFWGWDVVPRKDNKKTVGVPSFLVGVPLLWSEGVKTSDAMIYFFSVWLALVFAAVWLARRLGAGAVEKSLETDN